MFQGRIEPRRHEEHEGRQGYPNVGQAFLPDIRRSRTDLRRSRQRAYNLLSLRSGLHRKLIAVTHRTTVMSKTVTTVLVACLFGCEQSSPPVDEVDRQEELTEDASEAEMDHSELVFFNSLSGRLEIELTTPTDRVGSLDNTRANPGTEIISIKLVAEVFNHDSETFRDPTNEELQSIAFRANNIRLRGEGGEVVVHHAANGEFFTVQELLDAVVETEKQSRGRSDWLGGLDAHHVYFEGIRRDDDGVWDIHWGS